jgi:subtilisin family serine protease
MDGNTTPGTRGADFAASRGILVVNSLGNEGSSSWYYLSAPSDGDSVMGIGAVDGSGYYASFSSHGPSSDGRVKPDVAAQGSGVYCVDAYSGEYTFAGGTSFSSPIMAGMAACLWQANPEHTNMQVADALRMSASQYLAPDDLLGYGIPDLMQANNILTVIDGPEQGAIDITAYPNPFTSEFRISLSGMQGKGSGQVTITDVTGRIVFAETVLLTSGNPEITLSDLDNLPGGMYIITIKTTAGIANEVVVKR